MHTRCSTERTACDTKLANFGRGKRRGRGLTEGVEQLLGLAGRLGDVVEVAGELVAEGVTGDDAQK